MITIHAETCADPKALRWVFDGACLNCSGIVNAVPGPLGAHPDIASITATHQTVTVQMRQPTDWRERGPVIEAEIVEALEHAEDWQIDNVDVLREAAAAVMRGWFGEYVASHGGAIELVGTRGNTVDVALRGACHGCPAAALSLQLRYRRELEAVVGGPVIVNDVSKAHHD